MVLVIAAWASAVGGAVGLVVGALAGLATRSLRGQAATVDARRRRHVAVVIAVLVALPAGWVAAGLWFGSLGTNPWPRLLLGATACGAATYLAARRSLAFVLRPHVPRGASRVC